MPTFWVFDVKASVMPANAASTCRTGSTNRFLTVVGATHEFL